MALVQAPTPSGTDAHFGASGTAVPTATVSPPSIARSRCHWRIRAPDLIPSLRAASGSWRTSVYGQPAIAPAATSSRPETTSAEGTEREDMARILPGEVSGSAVSHANTELPFTSSPAAQAAAS